MGPMGNVDTQNVNTDSADSDAGTETDYGNVMFNAPSDTTWGVVDAQDDVVVFNPLTEP